MDDNEQQRWWAEVGYQQEIEDEQSSDDRPQEADTE